MHHGNFIYVQALHLPLCHRQMLLITFKSISKKVVEGSLLQSKLNAIGGMASFDIAKNTSWNVEYQFTGDAWAIGTGIMWKF